jgi:hypothetical protein
VKAQSRPVDLSAANPETLTRLRKGCLRILAEAGCNIRELQSRSGHLTLSELQKYIDKADKRFAADRAAEKVIAHKAKQKTERKIAA